MSFEKPLYQFLGLGTGDEDVGVDQEGPATEVSLSQDILYGFLLQQPL